MSNETLQKESDPQNINETFEEALSRLNKDGIFSPEEIERAKKLHESIERMEECQKRFTSGFWDKVFSLIQDAEQHKQAKQGGKKINPPRQISPENRIYTDKLKKDMSPMFEEMRALTEQSRKDSRVTKEALDTFIGS